MAKLLKLELHQCACGATLDQINSLAQAAESANQLLASKKGKGSDFLGWVNLPSSITNDEIEAIQSAANTLKAKADLIIVIGIGGSYLGSKAVLEALSDNFAMLHKRRTEPTIIFAGQNISEDYTAQLLAASKEYSIATVIISKSGTTTEPALAFRIIKKEIESRYGKAEAAGRIVAVTDKSRGALRKLANDEGYQTFIIPDDVGGRFSVLTPVGLLPLSAAGIDIAQLVQGARDMERATAPEVPYAENIAAQYAAARNTLYKKGYKIEILASYEPQLQYIAEWWKQLYGESEGKENKGIFPASVTLTADLHSMGQYIQQGERMLFETVLSVEKPKNSIVVQAEAEDLDGLNFLAGKRISEINSMAELGVTIAHTDGGVPNIRISIPEISAYYIGALLYFFERACGISGYMLGVNPFDQPGVEEYKVNMFALLEKPGYEQQTKDIKSRVCKK